MLLVLITLTPCVLLVEPTAMTSLSYLSVYSDGERLGSAAACAWSAYILDEESEKLTGRRCVADARPCMQSPLQVDVRS